MKKSALQRYRMAVRDGADPDPFRTEMAHKAHSTLVLRSPSTVFCGQFRDAHPDMSWSYAFAQMRVSPDRPPYFDSDEAFAGFHRNR